MSLLEKPHRISKSIVRNNRYFGKGGNIFIMVRKEIRNGEPTSRNTTNTGICKLSGMQAEVTSFYIGSIECKTDAMKTYRFKGYKCSLQEKTCHLNPACIDVCPLIQKEYL